MKTTTKNALKEYSEPKQWQSVAISTGVTFLSAFIVAIAAMMPIDHENFTTATIVALLLTGARAGVKAILQYLLTKIK